MSKFKHLGASNNDETPEFFGAGSTKTPDVDAAVVYAEVVLDAALTAAARRSLKQHPRLHVLLTNSATETELIAEHVKNQDRAPLVYWVTELQRLKGRNRLVGRDSLDKLQYRSVLFVTHDLNMLDPAVHAVCDLMITLPRLTAARLRQVIRKLTGQTARHVTQEMAALDLEVILACLRPGMPARQCVHNLQRAVERRYPECVMAGPTLAQLPLTRPVRAWADRLLADIEMVNRAELPTSALKHGILEGPPGTGKTSIARALAASAQWNFVETRVDKWLSTGDGALGGATKNLRLYFEELRASEPAIGFLDEIDSIPDRNRLSPHGRDWWTPLVTQFLTEIDGIRQSGKKILLLGATNHFTNLDPALVRPGRLSHRLSVLPPETAEEVADLFRHYLGRQLDENALKRLGRLARGATPAAIEAWVDAAKALARSKDRPLTLADMTAQIIPKQQMSDQDRNTVALHEAGHAVVARVLGHDVASVSILETGVSGGHVLSRMPTELPALGDIEDLVTVIFAGRAADLTFGSGANTGASDDLERATRLLVTAYQDQGLGDQLTSNAALTGREMPGAALDRIEKDLRRLLDRATGILRENEAVVRRVANLLMSDWVLGPSDLADIFDRAGSEAAAERLPSSPDEPFGCGGH